MRLSTFWIYLLGISFLLSFIGSFWDPTGWSGALTAGAFVLTGATFIAALVWRRKPRLATGLPRSEMGKRYLLASALICASLFATGVLTHLIAGAGFGIGDALPVLAQRERYVLSDHGQTVTVSRTRFVLTGAGFTLAWHAVAFGMVTFCAYQFSTKREIAA